MEPRTLMDLGRHAGQKAVEAVGVVAQLVDTPDQRVVLLAYAAGMVCAHLAAAAVVAVREEKGESFQADDAFVRGIMAKVVDMVVNGVAIGQKMAEGTQP
jgi:hypothetical protein